MAELKEHVVDGIEEYDNPLPRWWLYGFYLSILFAVGYAIAYPSLWFWGGTRSWTSANQYDAIMAAVPKAQLAKVDLVALAGNPAVVEEGKTIFKTYCVACHGDNAEGKIGPPLVPHKWRYGGEPENILTTIRGGRPGGMPVWGKVLPDEKIQKVAAYVYTLSYGKSGPEWPPKAGASGAPAAPASGAPAAPPSGAPAASSSTSPAVTVSASPGAPATTAPAAAGSPDGAGSPVTSPAAPSGAPIAQPSGGSAASTP